MQKVQPSILKKCRTNFLTVHLVSLAFSFILLAQWRNHPVSSGKSDYLDRGLLQTYIVYEPPFEWYKVNKFICCVYVSSRLFLPSRLGWQLSSMMTEAALTPLHWVLFLWWPWWRPWLRLCRRWCPLTHLDASARQPYCIHVAHFVADQYFIFVHPLSAAITRLTVLKKGGLFVRRLDSFSDFSH